MAEGYKWVRVQVPVWLHQRVTQQKGRASWDDTVVQALIATLATSGEDGPPATSREVPRE